MNKEDYVSMEVAKLLYEKGFKINGNYLWNAGTLCPTLYEAAKWLRNSHNIHIVIDNYACGYAWFLYKADNGTRISEYAEDGPNDGGCWDTYEEALNAGILEALKLI